MPKVDHEILSADEFRRLRLSDDPDAYQLAAHGSAAPAVWREVISRFPDLREWVAHNKTAPLEILRVLAADADPRVRCAVAVKRKLDDDLFALLAQDPDAAVRRDIAGNPKAPVGLVERLLHDRSTAVRAAAARALERRSGRRGPSTVDEAQGGR